MTSDWEKDHKLHPNDPRYNYVVIGGIGSHESKKEVAQQYIDDGWELDADKGYKIFLRKLRS